MSGDGWWDATRARLTYAEETKGILRNGPRALALGSKKVHSCTRGKHIHTYSEPEPTSMCAGIAYINCAPLGIVASRGLTDHQPAWLLVEKVETHHNGLGFNTLLKQNKTAARAGCDLTRS